MASERVIENNVIRNQAALGFTGRRSSGVAAPDAVTAWSTSCSCLRMGRMM